MLTFPADKSDFAAPNGVTYAWDDGDGKWRVKAFRSIDDFIVQLEDNPPADSESKEGDLWFDTSPDSLTLFVYTGSVWVPAAPPVSLDGINATIEAALIVQNDLLARVNAGETVQTGVLDDLTTLQHKVEALEGTVIDGKWYAESRSNPREGGFDITSGGLQSMGDWGADYLRVHKTDSTGKVFTFAEVSTGDYIRIGAPGSTAVYKINEIVSGSLDWQAFGVELANSTGTPIPDLTYDFEFLPSFDPSAYATVQYVDAQDDLDVKLAAVNDVSIGFRIKSGGNTLISTATEGELGLYHVKDPSDGNESWAANKGYVDSNFINIAGQTDLDPQVFKIRQPNSDGNFRSFINIHNGSMNLYNVADPSGSGHEKWATNKEYVDAQIASISSSINLNNYLPLAGGTVTGDLTVEGVAQFASAKNSNAPVAGADLTNKSYTDGTFAKKTDRPGLRFGYESGGSGVPSSGKFRWYIDGGRRLRLSATTRDSIPWAVDTPIADINFSEGHMFTIWATVTGTDNWRIKQTGTINRIDYHDNDVLCYVSYHAENGSFSTSAEYNITIAGLI